MRTQAPQGEEEEEAVVSELRRQLENEELNPEQKISLLNDGLNSETISHHIRLTSVSLSCLFHKFTSDISHFFIIIFVRLCVSLPELLKII